MTKEDTGNCKGNSTKKKKEKYVRIYKAISLSRIAKHIGSGYGVQLETVRTYIIAQEF